MQYVARVLTKFRSDSEYTEIRDTFRIFTVRPEHL